MAKAIGKVLKIYAVVSFAALFAVATIVTGGLFAGFIAAAQYAGATYLGIYAIGSALDPPQIATEDFKGDQGHNLMLTADPSPVRWQLLGETATAGTLIFRDAVGTDNSDLWMVIALAGHECDSLTKFEWDGEIVSFSGNNAVGKYHDKMFLYFHDGSETQVADAGLVAASAKWTSSHTGKGICYAVIKLIFDKDLFQSGLEEMRFYLKGAKAYDPRLDSTRTEVSGIGSHRVDDQSTWEWTDDTALLTTRYAYGYRLGGTLVYGKGIVDNRISWEDAASSAGSNEEAVTLKAGGTEKRYTCNGIQFPTQTHARNISAITSSMAGMFYQTGSKWRMQSGVARAATKIRSTDDFIGPVKSRGQRDPRDKYNAVKGLFSDATQRTEATDYPSLRVASAVAADGNQEHWLHLNLPFTNSNSMAQRISKIALMRTRMDRDAILPLNAIGLQDAVADTVTVTHLPLNINAMKMRLIKWEFRIVNIDGGVGCVIVEHLEEEDDTVLYSWDEITEEMTATGGNSQLRWTKPAAAPGDATAGAQLGTDVTDEGGAPVGDDEALNILQEWSEVSGPGVPDDNADVTSANTAADTALVNGAAAATVRADSLLGGDLTRSNVTLLDRSSLDGVDHDIGPGSYIDQGNTVLRPVTRGVAHGSKNDADAVSYTTAWSSGDLPIVKFGGGGITWSPAMNVRHGPVYSALNPSVSGFTVKARLREVNALQTNVTDGPKNSTPWELHKSASLEAYDDNYQFKFSWDVGNEWDFELGKYIGGFATVEIWVNDGGGYTQVGSASGSGGINPAGSTTSKTATVTVSVDGVGIIGGTEFKIVLGSGASLGSVITQLTHVKYTTVATVVEETATPTGSAPVDFDLKGGSETL